MLLNLIAQVARPDGSAGPTIVENGTLVLLRDWLCDALTPMGQRDPRRLTLEQRVREDLAHTGKLPSSPDCATQMIQDEVRARLRSSGKTNVSRAVSELVNAGLLKRHYQGYRVDHHNRGARRQAVYTLAATARGLINGTFTEPSPPPRQIELAL
jgi:hypothetical protein